MDKTMDNLNDNSLVVKVMTFKAGNFPFSRRYDRARVEPLLAEIRTLREVVEDLPILPAYAAHLKKSVIFKSIHSTAALEGNPLSEEQVEELLEQGVQIPGKEDFAREIRNLELVYDVFKFAASLRLERENIDQSESWICDEDRMKSIHKSLTDGIKHQTNIPGKYRDHLVRVGDSNHGGIYTPPKINADIQTLMAAFVRWLNSPAMLAEPPAVRAALAHYHLSLIHPFGDGNGRTSRIIEAIILQGHGFYQVPVMLSNYYYQHVDDYYWVFSLCRKNKDHDMTAFVDFMARGLAASLRDTREAITNVIRIFALRDHIHHLKLVKSLTRRRYELLSLLLDNNRPFTLSDLVETFPYRVLYRDISERTARRDLAKLTEMRLLRRDDQGRYRLNHRILG